MAGVFEHGDLRLYLLKLLDEAPRHGYKLMRTLEDRFLGMYTPSAGSVYPRLAALAEEGLAELIEGQRRRAYRITDRGREELEARLDELAEMEERVASSAKRMAQQVREEVRESVRDLREELRTATRDVLREERRSRRSERDEARETRGAASHAHRALRRELDAFVSDVTAAARQQATSPESLASLRQVLLDARAAVMAALATTARGG